MDSPEVLQAMKTIDKLAKRYPEKDVQMAMYLAAMAIKSGVPLRWLGRFPIPPDDRGVSP